jgi:hypothetical protein
MSAYQESVGLRISRQPGAVPTAAHIDEGQLAFNLADQRIFARFGEVIKDITDHYTQEEIDQALNGKVDAVEGMGLSERSYTQQEKTKLANVGSMANRNVYISAQPPDDAIGQDGDIWLQHWS